MLQRLLGTAMVGASALSTGLFASDLPAFAGSKLMPPGYTLSKTQLRGQHCYRHNNEANLYCYPYKLTESIMMQHRSRMMKKGGDTMMEKESGSMMKGQS